MKPIYCLLFSFCICCQHPAFAQANVYHPFPLAQNTEWRADNFGIDCMFNPYSLCLSWRDYTGGDTTINAVKYTKIYQDGITYTSGSYSIYNHFFFASLREDTLAKKIYAIFSNGFSEYLLYDFNLEVGDTLTTAIFNHVVVDSIDSILIGSDYHQKINFHNDYPYPIFIIEGIGSNGGIDGGFENGSGAESQSVLKCFSVNDTLLYEDSSYTFTDCSLTPITLVNEISEARDVNIYPNPASEKTTLLFNMPHSAHARIEVYDLNGGAIFGQVISSAEHSISLDVKQWSSGIYIVRLITDDGTSLVRKLVIE